MKVEITEALELIVSAETPAEAIALKCWGEKFPVSKKQGESSLVIHYTVAKAEDPPEILTGPLPVWTTESGDCIRVAHMSDQHVQHTLKFLVEEDRAIWSIINGKEVGQWISIFSKEISDRGIPKPIFNFAED